MEKDFQAGLDAYKAGQTDAARQDFDNAFNALLESNLDVRSDDRLEKEFDRIVEGVNHLDLGGLAADSEAQKSEPAPIDETNGITPSADAKVIAKAQAEIKSTHSDLPLMMTDQVAGYISYFSNRGRGTFERAFARSGRYHDMMVSILKEEGVPAGSDLSGAGRIRIPSSRGFARRRPRHLAVHGQPRPGLRPAAQPVGG